MTYIKCKLDQGQHVYLPLKPSSPGAKFGWSGASEQWVQKFERKTHAAMHYISLAGLPAAMGITRLDQQFKSTYFTKMTW
jgi:hypothetical protein